MTSKGEMFIKYFKEEIENNVNIRNFYKTGEKLTDYTNAMKTAIKNILEEINGCNFKCKKDGNTDSYYTFNPEYFKIDYTSWDNTRINPYPDTGINLYSWNFDFAIEHENKKSDWTYELLKLSFIRADVRVVIGYVDRRKCSKEKDVIEAQVNEFIYPVDVNEEFYVILLNTESSEDDKTLGMKVYSIKGRSVCEYRKHRQ